jgi:hypothetical protein
MSFVSAGNKVERDRRRLRMADASVDNRSFDLVSIKSIVDLTR